MFALNTTSQQAASPIKEARSPSQHNVLSPSKKFNANLSQNCSPLKKFNDKNKTFQETQSPLKKGSDGREDLTQLLQSSQLGSFNLSCGNNNNIGAALSRNMNADVTKNFKALQSENSDSPNSKTPKRKAAALRMAQFASPQNHKKSPVKSSPCKENQVDENNQSVSPTKKSLFGLKKADQGSPKKTSHMKAPMLNNLVSKATSKDNDGSAAIQQEHQNSDGPSVFKSLLPIFNEQDDIDSDNHNQNDTKQLPLPSDQIALDDDSVDNDTDLSEGNGSFFSLMPVQANLPNLLQDKRSAYQAPTPRFADLIQVDSPLLSFGQFHSNKLLGSHLTFQNKSNQVVKFLVKIEPTPNLKDSLEILDEFYEEDLPFKMTNFSKRGALENQSEFFQIEEPYTRQLVNEIVLELDPQESLTVIIVLRTPLVAKANLFTILSAYQQNDKACFEDRIRVALCGRLQNPEVKCLKSEWDNITQTQVIPLAIKRNQPLQKFRLPFRTPGHLEETEFEFIFIKTVPQDNNEHMCRVFSSMVFFCQPSVLKVGGDLSQMAAVLTVQIKLDCDQLNMLDDDDTLRPLSKLLIARIKGTNILQSFFVQISLIEGGDD